MIAEEWPEIKSMDRGEVCEEYFQALKRQNGQVCQVANLYNGEKPCLGFCKGLGAK